MKKYVRKAILLTITLVLVGASPVQMVAAVAVEQSNLKSSTQDKTKKAALLDKVFKMPKRQSKVNASADTDKAPAEVQLEPKVDPVPEPEKPVVAQKEKVSEPTLAPQLKATETTTGTYGTSPWTLDPDTGVLEFGAGTLAGGEINGAAAFASYVSMIKEIKFSTGAKLPSSCQMMFANLSSLKKFESANLDTSGVANMNYMFYNSKATMLDVSAFDTSAVTEMNSMFHYSAATTLDVSGFDTSVVTDMSYMFSSSKATTINMSGFDTSAVTNMRGMFSYSAATTLDLSGFDTSVVTDMSYMFSSSKATTLDLSNFDTSAVTGMRDMFRYSAATTLDVSGFDTSAVTDMGGMFSDLAATTLDVSSFDTSSVTNMSAMFGYSAATTLDLSNFDTSAVTDMSAMFCYSAATTINLSNFNTSAVTNMANMFQSSTAWTLDVSDFDTSEVTNMKSMFQSSKATTVDVCGFDTSKVSDMYYMFAFSNATMLDLSTFDTSEVTDMSGMFYGLEVTTLDLSTFDTGKVTNMRNMFAQSKATTLNLSNFNTSSITNMSSMFYYSDATTIDVSSFDTSLVNNMSYMFYQSKVPALDLSHFTFAQECDTTNMLYVYSHSLWKLTLGANQTFNSNANIQNPSVGSTIPGAGSDYVSGNRWQIVGEGTDHAPTGALISGTDIPSDSRAVTTTYVWEHREKWRGVNGNSPWYLNPDDGVLTFYKSEDSSPTVLSESVSNNLNNTFGWRAELPELVTAIRFEDDVAAPVNSNQLFSDLENLQSFDDTNLDTSNVEDMSSMFAYSAGLSTLDLSHFNTDKVENMENMFGGLSSLTALNIESFNTSNVTDMSYMFSDTSLSSLDLSHFNTDKVENMACMFLMMPNLTALDLSSFNTSNVTDMFGMFAVNGLKHLNLSHFDTARVENMQVMFVGASLETLDISSFDLSGLKELNSEEGGIGVTSPVAFMFSSWQALDPESDQGSNLWQVKLGEQTVFPDDPGFEAAPAAGTTIPSTSYVTNDAAWQIVGNGTVLNPKGDKVSTTAMWDEAVRPVTYVWANQNQASPSIVSVDNLNFGTLSLANTSLTPTATNMATGNLKLGDLDGTYQVSVAQAADWEIGTGGQTISSDYLPIKYGDTSLASGTATFVSGDTEDAVVTELDVKFNHATGKNFTLDLRGSGNLSPALGETLTTTMTWTLSDTPE
ncbi:BspA family leucine-rich repeat surface protein [Leuconostoc falkenbergense]|uniref:BspA family leucine-rich repeat surface protein n=1 Tax=Leuconostoc falkenbergense TaxID=2766470 RepID=UPI001966ED7D|nr:BspA family leucine-rich repeat surface protein [Leuconostoc falkenbergense]QSB52064.1 BspA family leucine-rich repeat surface protein [Leuconostoc falkenbergense]